MKYSTNFKKHKNGNAADEGTVLTIKVEGAYFISGGVYQCGVALLAFQTEAGDDTVDIILKRKGRSIKGKATLKVRAFDSQWRGAGWNDEFTIL